MAIFFYLFSSLMILSSIGVITSRNPVYCVLWLIFTFLNSSAIFIQLGAEFIAMTIIIVYVGAVAVLFLFVVMMLNINLAEIKSQLLGNRIVGACLMFVLIIDFILIVKSALSSNSTISIFHNQASGKLSNTHSIGAILYTDYIIVFQLSGLVLLLAMVGCIVLTVRKREGVEKQNAHKQIARTIEESIEIIKVKTRVGVNGINYK